MYSVTIQVVSNLSLTPKQKFRFSTQASYTQYVGYGTCGMGRYQILGNLVGQVISILKKYGTEF